jgi:hypothetical protein
VKLNLALSFLSPSKDLERSRREIRIVGSGDMREIKTRGTGNGFCGLLVAQRKGIGIVSFGRSRP